MKSYVVIGLGRFGMEMAAKLYACGEDVLAIEGIGQMGETLGRGIAGLINVFNPGLVVIGGRLIVGRDYLMLPIRAAVNKLSLSKVSADTKIQFSRLGRSAAAKGDCLLSRAKVLNLL